MKDYRLTKSDLMNRLSDWDAFLHRKIHLIACGGTALTLLGITESTKDTDFIIPVENDYKYLAKTLKDLGYAQITGSGWKREGEIFRFDLFKDNLIHTTRLLESPLDVGNNIIIKEFSHIYAGALNYYDIIISKVFRGTTQDFEDCLVLVRLRRSEIDLTRLRKRFKETVLYETAEDRVNRQFEYFMSKVREENIYER